MATDYLDLTTEANVLPTIIAAECLGALASNMALLGLVNRDYDDEVKEYGNIVTIGKRGAMSANDKGEGADVTVQDPTTTKTDVTLNKHKEATFGAEDIAIMLERPDQMSGYGEDSALAILEAIEADLAGLYSGFSQTIDATAGIAEANFRESRRLLNSAKAPGRDRFACVHEDAEYGVLGIERIVNRDYAESLGSAVLKENYTGKFAGFHIFMDQNIVVTGAVCKNIFGHRNCAVLATRPMRIASPKLVAQATLMEKGIGLRVTHAYNFNALAEQMTIDVLYGVSELRDNHGVVVSTTEI